MSSFTLPADSDLSAIAVFNVLDSAYGMEPGNAASQNGAALQAAVNAAQAAGGGTILIPTIGTYRIEGTITIGSTISLVITGTAQGEVGQVNLLKVKDDGTPDNTDLFVVETNDGHGDDTGGVTFEALQIQYTTGATAGAAIHVASGSQNVRVQRVVFTDCPQGVWFEDSLQGSMLECTAISDVNPGTPLTLGTTETKNSSAIETYIAGCLFRSNSSSGVAVQIYSVEHVRMINVRLEGYLQGILITPGALMKKGQTAFYGTVEKCYFTNVSCFPFNDPSSPQPSTDGVGLLVQPTAGQYAQELWFANCEFTPPEAGTAYAGAGIVVDPINGPNGGGVIDQVRFVDCYSCLWPGPGMDIVGGTNIEILGGYYSCNGVPLTPPPSLPLAGIALTGSASGVRITGAACNNSVIFHGAAKPATQQIGIYVGDTSAGVRIQGCDLTGNVQYGISVSGPAVGALGPTNVFVRHCDFTGSGGAVRVSLPVSNVQISECPGYNDQATPLATAAPSGPFSGLTYGYYGPVAFYASGGSLVAVTIDTHATGLGFGGFTLGPGESAEIIVAVGGNPPTTFFMVGK